MTRSVTWNGRSAAFVMLALVAVLAGGFPAAATPSPPSVTSPTTVPGPPGPVPPAPRPAPPVTPPPTARIASLSTAARGADGGLADATARRDQVRVDITAAETALAAADAATSVLNTAASRAAARYDASRAELRRVAVATYMESGTASQLEAWVSSGDLLDAGRREKLLADAGESRRQIVDQARADRVAAARAVAEAEADRRHKRERVRELRNALGPAEQAVADAQATATQAHVRLARWQSIALGTGTPILGAPAVTGAELAAWFRATRHTARTTVPIEQLADLYISEGLAEGVRGDIAFAQSIIETGSFSFPDGGLVSWTDNNFAGVGACDSCAHGHVYADAQTGVRVQMQYLHVYADRTMTAAGFANPPIDPNMDRNFRKGQAPTWAGLTHTWATADGYGDAILRIYEEFLDWLTAHS